MVAVGATAISNELRSPTSASRALSAAYRSAFWTATVLLLGPLGYLAQRAVENARAWRPIDAAQPAPRRLLIESAA